MDETKEKREKKVEFSWLPFWAAGFMFTIGYVGINPVLSTYPWWHQLAIWVVSWLFWPLILGLNLAR